MAGSFNGTAGADPEASGCVNGASVLGNVAIEPSLGDAVLRLALFTRLGERNLRPPPLRQPRTISDRGCALIVASYAPLLRRTDNELSLRWNGCRCSKASR